MTRAFIIISLACSLIGCPALQPETDSSFPSSSASPKHYPPDFSKADSDFVEVDCKVLASEFLNEYAGKYVTFAANFGKPPTKTSGNDSGRVATVWCGGVKSVNMYWEDTNLSRSLVRFDYGNPIRVYGYVLGKGDETTLDPARPGRISSFGDTVILAMRVK